MTLSIWMNAHRAPTPKQYIYSSFVFRHACLSTSFFLLWHSFDVRVWLRWFYVFFFIFLLLLLLYSFATRFIFKPVAFVLGVRLPFIPQFQFDAIYKSAVAVYDCFCCLLVFVVCAMRGCVFVFVVWCQRVVRFVGVTVSKYASGVNEQCDVTDNGLTIADAANVGATISYRQPRHVFILYFNMPIISRVNDVNSVQWIR